MDFRKTEKVKTFNKWQAIIDKWYIDDKYLKLYLSYFGSFFEKTT